MDYKQSFAQWVKMHDVTIADSLPETGLCKGQNVMFTNDYGISFGPHEILGFDAQSLGGRCVYIDHDSYWLPCRPEQLTLVNEHL